MTSKWALRLGLFILFVGDALVDEGGGNLLRILIYFSTDFFFHTSKKAAIRMPMGHVEFSWHSFFFVRLARWSSPCVHQDQLMVFRQLFGVFDVTRFISRLRF